MKIEREVKRGSCISGHSVFVFVRALVPELTLEGPTLAVSAIGAFVKEAL